MCSLIYFDSKCGKFSCVLWTVLISKLDVRLMMPLGSFQRFRDGVPEWVSKESHKIASWGGGSLRGGGIAFSERDQQVIVVDIPQGDHAVIVEHGVGTRSCSTSSSWKRAFGGIYRRNDCWRDSLIEEDVMWARLLSECMLVWRRRAVTSWIPAAAGWDKQNIRTRQNKKWFLMNYYSSIRGEGM